MELMNLQMCTMQYVDCSARGGYDPIDPCNHTCRDNGPSLNLENLVMCTKQYTDCSRSGGYDLNDPCRHTCNNKKIPFVRPAAPVMCTKQYVNCSAFGGYDPADPCNHTCKNTKVQLKDLQNLRVIDGSVFDMGDVTNGDQGVIAFANTGKNEVNFNKVTADAGSTTVFMGGLMLI